MQVYYLKILENASILFENINTIAIRLNDILYIAVHLDNDHYFLLIFLKAFSMEYMCSYICHLFNAGHRVSNASFKCMTNTEK